MKKYQLLLLIALLASGVLASCNSGDPMVKKYGLDFNKNRLELGLPVLQANWKLMKNTDGILRWAPEGNLQGAGFIHKEVTIKDDKLYGEENRFEGKNKYQRDGADYNEEVYIGCYFDEKEQISEWNCIFKGTRNPVSGAASDGDTRLTVKQADSIVRSWGIKY
jgi:hypothetical protein